MRLRLNRPEVAATQLCHVMNINSFELTKHVFSGDVIKDFVINADRSFWRPRIDFENSDMTKN